MGYFGRYHVQLLHAVTGADGEHEERHEDRERIQTEAQKRDHAELPDHRCGRAADGQPGQIPVAAVEVHSQNGKEERTAEEDRCGFATALGDIGNVLRERNQLLEQWLNY